MKYDFYELKRYNIYILYIVSLIFCEIKTLQTLFERIICIFSWFVFVFFVALRREVERARYFR